MTTQSIIKKYEEMSDNEIAKEFNRKSKQDKKKEKRNKRHHRKYQDEQKLLATLQAETNQISKNHVLL